MKSKIKYYQLIKTKKHEDCQHVFLLENIKVINEILYTGHIQKLIIDEKKTDLINKYQNLKIPICLLPSFEIQKISTLKNVSPIIALTKKIKLPSIEVDGYINLVLDNIQDPGNLGSIIRTATWFGLKNIFLSQNSVDVYNPKCVQASMGACLQIPVYYMDLKLLLKKYSHMASYACTLEGTELPQIKNSLQKNCFVIFGNEGAGIQSDLIMLTTQQIKIPAYCDNVDSLNVAASCAIILYELKK